ncbi:MAG: hypothetical protein K9M08_13645, partial [Pirellula sp.]|nr:hypothetical protein [Pirellula sp.]
NRTTVRIRLEPFSLGDTRKYLERRNVRLDDFQFAQLYMAIGGVPIISIKFSRDTLRRRT